MACLDKMGVLSTLIDILNLDWFFTFEHLKNNLRCRFNFARRQFNSDVLNVSNYWIEFASFDTSKRFYYFE